MPLNPRATTRLILPLLLSLAGLGIPGRAFAQGGTWATKAAMPTPTLGMGAGVVNGILYAVRGEVVNDCRFVRTLVAYDPVKDTWTTLCHINIHAGRRKTAQ